MRSAFRSGLVSAVACVSVTGLGFAATEEAQTKQVTKDPVASPPGPNLELKQVQVLFRHGARTPLSKKHGSGELVWNVCGPDTTVPYLVRRIDGGPPGINKHCARQRAELLKGDCHLGQLTLLGQRQAHDLGKSLAGLYREQLNLPLAPPNDGSLYVRSSNVERTIGTAAGVLTGLFPEGLPGMVASASEHVSAPAPASLAASAATAPAAASASHQPHPAIHPVTIYVAPEKLEWLFPNFDCCPRFNSLWNAAAKRRDAAPEGWAGHFKDRLSAVLASVPEESSRAVDKPWGVIELMARSADLSAAADHAVSREAHGMPQISGMTAEHVETLRRMSAAIVVELFGHPGGSGIRQGEPGQLAGSAGPPAAPLGTFQESLRLSVGRLLADITSKMESAASHMTPLRVGLYAAHDTTVLPLLLALVPPRQDGSDDGMNWPPFASNITFELWGPKDPSVVGEKSHFVRVLYNLEPLELSCSREGRECSLTDFRNMVAPFLPVDFASECHLPADSGDSGAETGAPAKDVSISGAAADDQQETPRAPRHENKKKKRARERRERREANSNQ